MRMKYPKQLQTFRGLFSIELNEISCKDIKFNKKGGFFQKFPKIFQTCNDTASTAAVEI